MRAKTWWISSWWQETWYAVLAVVASLTFGGLMLLYMGESPAQVYGMLLRGSLGQLDLLSATLAATVPYILCGLALALAFRAGLFNIGAEGQLFLGAMATALVGRYLTLPWLSPILALAVGVLAGMLWAALPALLKIRFGVHEVINTIMLNYIAIYFCSYLVNIPALRSDPSMPRTADIAIQAQLPTVGTGAFRLDLGLIVAVVLALVLLWILNTTRFGFAVKVMGMQPRAAETAGISTAQVTLWSLVGSGAIAGLAGACYVTSSTHPYFETGFSPGWGYWGIALALLARNHPVGVIFAGFLFGILETGSSYLDTSLGIPRELIYILEAVIILMISSRLFERLLGDRS